MNKNDLFSVRTGSEPKQAMQIDDLDEAARNAIYNVFHPIIPALNEKVESDTGCWQYKFWETLGFNFYNMRYNEIFDKNYYDAWMDYSIYERYEYIYKGKFNELFDFIEFAYQTLLDMKNDEQEKFIILVDDEMVQEIDAILKTIDDNMNSELERTNVGYRFLEGKFIPLISAEEREEIAKANKTPYQNASEHIKKATNLFSDRENPDYENSIKESICAVEAVAKELTGDDKATLNSAIQKLEKNGIKLHSAFKEALNKLYGYTSDESGVRHAGVTPIQQDQATARFMLVTCSAFVNYIIANTPEK